VGVRRRSDVRRYAAGSNFSLATGSACFGWRLTNLRFAPPQIR
jgi:hypothetical protein